MISNQTRLSFQTVRNQEKISDMSKNSSYAKSKDSSMTGTLTSIQTNPLLDLQQIVGNQAVQQMVKAKILDFQLEEDFKFIKKKVDGIVGRIAPGLNNSFENQVIAILRKWAEEKFTTNPKYYPTGGQYLDKLFTKLNGKIIDIGIITTQWTSYYDLILNHFQKVEEVKSIRDKYSVIFKDDNGQKEDDFGSFFWEEFKDHGLEQIGGFFVGLGKGFLAGAKGLVEMVHTLITDPAKFFSDLKNIPHALNMLWQNRDKLWNDFASKSPVEQAEMIGEIFGQIEFTVASSAAGAKGMKGLEKLSETTDTLGEVAKAVKTMVKLPETIVGGTAKVVGKVILSGGRVAAEGFMFAAKGIYKLGSKMLNGTWSVVEKNIGKITRKIYYFFDDETRTITEVAETSAKEFVECSICKLTKKAEQITAGEKEIGKTSLNQPSSSAPKLPAPKAQQVTGKTVNKFIEELEGQSFEGISQNTTKSWDDLVAYAERPTPRQMTGGFRSNSVRSGNREVRIIEGRVGDQIPQSETMAKYGTKLKGEHATHGVGMQLGENMPESLTSAPSRFNTSEMKVVENSIRETADAAAGVGSRVETKTELMIEYITKGGEEVPVLVGVKREAWVVLSGSETEVPFVNFSVRLDPMTRNVIVDKNWIMRPSWND